MCKKLRPFLLGLKFTVRTDHKPLLGLFKKADSIENSRMLAMILSTAEFNFSLEYFPGKRNKLADFGTRQIELSEWPTTAEFEEDPMGLNSLMLFVPDTDKPDIEHSTVSQRDIGELTSSVN